MPHTDRVALSFMAGVTAGWLICASSTSRPPPPSSTLSSSSPYRLYMWAEHGEHLFDIDDMPSSSSKTPSPSPSPSPSSST